MVHTWLLVMACEPRDGTCITCDNADVGRREADTDGARMARAVGGCTLEHGAALFNYFTI